MGYYDNKYKTKEDLMKIYSKCKGFEPSQCEDFLDKIEEYDKVSGIYKIQFEKYCYIGESSNLRGRMIDHLTNIIDKSYSRKETYKPIYFGWRDSATKNANDFFEVLEVVDEKYCDDQKLLKAYLKYREKYFIDYYKQNNTCLNIEDTFSVCSNYLIRDRNLFTYCKKDETYNYCHHILKYNGDLKLCYDNVRDMEDKYSEDSYIYTTPYHKFKELEKYVGLEVKENEIKETLGIGYHLERLYPIYDTLERYCEYTRDINLYRITKVYEEDLYKTLIKDFIAEAISKNTPMYLSDKYQSIALLISNATTNNNKLGRVLRVPQIRRDKAYWADVSIYLVSEYIIDNYNLYAEDIIKEFLWS